MDLKEEFLSSIQEQDAAKAKDLLGDGILDKIGPDGYLNTAARCNQGSLVEELVVLGADVDKLDPLGMCALHYCTAKDLVRAISVLIFSDSQVDLPDPVGRTALMLSIHFGHKAAFDLLVEESQNINAVDKNGTSALRMAVDNGLVDFAKILIDKKAYLNLPDANGRTPLFSAAARGDEAMFALLLAAGADVNVRDAKGRNALLVAGALGQIKIVEQLIQVGVDINSKDLDGNNILHFVAGQYRDNIGQYFIKGSGEDLVDSTKIVVHGEPLDLEHSSNSILVASQARLLDSELSNSTNNFLPNAPVQTASQETYTDLVNLLIKSGIQTNDQNNKAETPLHLAARAGFQPSVESILSSGVDPALKDKDGQTAFQLASPFAAIQALVKKAHDEFQMLAATRPPHTPKVELGTGGGLLSPVGTPTSKSAENEAQVDSPAPPPAALNANPATSSNAAKNLDRNTSGQTPFLTSCATGNLKDVVTALKHAEADLNQKDFQGRTGLMLAAAQGHGTIVSYLIKKGAKTEVKDTNNMTALILAVATQHLEIVQFLIESGADVDTRLKGTPILMIAISKGNLELTQYLLKKGAGILEKDYRGATAIEYALASKSKEMLELIKITMKSKFK
jgi:ankyrin repeat protein